MTFRKKVDTFAPPVHNSEIRKKTRPGPLFYGNHEITGHIACVSINLREKMVHFPCLSFNPQFIFVRSLLYSARFAAFAPALISGPVAIVLLPSSSLIWHVVSGTAYSQNVQNSTNTHTTQIKLLIQISFTRTTFE